MGWQIDLFRVLEGQDPCKVRDVQYDWDTHPGYRVEDASDKTDSWIDHVLIVLANLDPPFEELGDRSRDDDGHVTHVRAIQTDGRCLANIYPSAADLRLKAGRDAETFDGEHFQQLWISCKALADEADCAVFPEDDDEPVDMALDVADARAIHNW